MKDILRKVVEVKRGELTDKISFFLRKDKVLIALETGVKGCPIQKGDPIVVDRSSTFIKIFALACTRCQATNCEIRSK